MDLTHLHLLITHLPIYGSILGALVLAFGLWSKSLPTQSAAYLIFVISALGAGTAYSSGEAAEETVENMQGVAESMIDPHEDFAIYGLWGLIILGAFSLTGLLFNLKKWGASRVLGVTILLVALISFGLVAYTGYLGGKIRHTETSRTTGTPFLPLQLDDHD